ncbi:uncharacterized protein KD926_005471 [Aspergillus affinis]|uniref:uncharacterized protein n=1 Tax=Aspergillus affinis TaxID=1070780 RepID=UPI0022FF40B3|nr:uncharacterized protein KD926_005471 [Aspergillus affinis]KAI9034791.1 hypothetical protein KD926_005471 [Aspergillus affinis]
MDLFIYHDSYRVWICKPCQYAICPRRLESHLRIHHQTHPTAATRVLRKIAHEKMAQRPWLDPATEPCIFPDPEAGPLPNLPLYTGYRCPRCSHVVRSPESLAKHIRERHPELRRPRGRQPAATRHLDRHFQGHPVNCQRFFPTGAGSSFFAVTPPIRAERVRQAKALTPAEFIRAQVEQALEEDLEDEKRQYQQIPVRKHPTEVSPWLELTRWPDYLAACDLAAAASLGALPDPVQEPLLALFTQSVERLIQRSYQTIKDRRINEFDQIRINTFLTQQPKIWDRPIQIHLKPKTYASYRRVWQRLICFVYRTSRPDPAVILRHQLTTSQLAALDRMVEAGTLLLRQTSPIELERLDRACLALSIALLDHPLKGEIYESAVVGFLAVLGLDPQQQTFRDPYGYTSYLSGLVKIAQMLVAEQAVHLAESGTVAYPTDALDDMRARFLLFGVQAPFGWIARLRTYGKKIQNSTTSLGYIYWSDDEQTLSYRDLKLTMTGLRNFVRIQIELVQQSLEDLFLLHDEETRDDIVPVLSLQKLQDDPVNNRRGWNFLQNHANSRVLSPTGKQWLMDRVLTTDWLRDEFLEIRSSDSEVIWRRSAVDRYLQQVDWFLERLLLVIHITGGQPGRATELLSLRHSNTVQGRHRNIFVEHGLVSTVTSYHKGYSVSNSTKIIHRYLPKPVSELLVYYLWLILPFWQAIQRLTRRTASPRSPFLWPHGEGTWDPSRLRAALQREAQIHLQTKMNILSYRHAAIAISRVHLKIGGFKRDYGTDSAALDEQASHGSWAAGTVYARGLQEAPGHVEARRRQYRAISREWHGFLGFETYLGPRKRTAEEPQGRSNQAKRACISIDMEEDDDEL